MIEVATPLGFTVRCARRYWEFIVMHEPPVLQGRTADISCCYTPDTTPSAAIMTAVA